MKVSDLITEYIESLNQNGDTFTATDIKNWILSTKSINIPIKKISDALFWFVRSERLYKQSKGHFYLNPSYTKPSKNTINLTNCVRDFLLQHNPYNAFESEDISSYLFKKDIHDFHKQQISSSLVHMCNRGELIRVEKGLYKKPNGDTPINKIGSEFTSTKRSILDSMKTLTLEERREILIEEFLDLTDQVLKSLSYTSLLEDSLEHFVNETKKMGFRPGAIRIKGNG